MKDLKDLGRSVIIYHPSGEFKFATVPIEPVSDNMEYKIVDKIVAEAGYVQIAYIEDGKVVGETYGGMPYLFELFEL